MSRKHLHEAVQTLQKIDIEIKRMQNKRLVVVNGTNLNGPLSFAITMDETIATVLGDDIIMPTGQGTHYLISEEEIHKVAEE